MQEGGSGVAASFCIRKVREASNTRPVRKKQVTYAMKCLRPRMRSDAEQFIIGVEDLVHETAILASLNHPNIIKVHGRAVGGTGSLRLSDGYFILLDRLQDTLSDRMINWKKISAAENKGSGRKSSQPTCSQLRTACSIADALSYLHSKNIVFRDLKPANIGFDSQGILKLFDFGFATRIDESKGPKQLEDMCGTPRYMAPEVGLERGYSLPVDVHSFGILFWEICSLKKPFSNVKSAEEFHQSVFERGVRPKVSRHWSKVLRDVMTKCWCEDPMMRPRMEDITRILKGHVEEVAALQKQKQQGQRSHDKSFRKSMIALRRLTG